MKKLFLENMILTCSNGKPTMRRFLRREEESFTTNIAVKFINLLVINTSKIRFELNLDNNSAIHSSIILGVNHNAEVACPICRKTFL